MDRRSFVKSAALSAGTLCSLVPNAQGRTTPPSERIRAGFVGVGGRAAALLNEFSVQEDVDVVAIADLDDRRIPAAVTAVEQRKGRSPQVHRDFRRVVDHPEIDVLVVGTPDHWHAIPTILGCLAGKDVYVEKPDGHNIVEGQRMVAAMRRESRIVQMGTQSRSLARMQEAIEYARSGRLGRVLVARAWETAKQGSIGRPPDGDPPPGVDYDMWLGPAPVRPFNPRRFHGSWRWFFDYGTGDLGNDGVHRIDYARWALDAAAQAGGKPPIGLPTRISAAGGKWYFDDMQEWPDTLQVTYEYSGTADDPGRILMYEMRLWTPNRFRGAGEGAILYGDQGCLFMTNSAWQAYDGDNQLVAEGKRPEPRTPHVRNFLECVRSRARPNADLETIGHPSSVFCHAANVAWRVGRQVQFDWEREAFVGDPEANALRTRPSYRKPWTLPDVT